MQNCIFCDLLSIFRESLVGLNEEFYNMTLSQRLFCFAFASGSLLLLHALRKQNTNKLISFETRTYTIAQTHDDQIENYCRQNRISKLEYSIIQNYLELASDYTYIFQTFCTAKGDVLNLQNLLPANFRSGVSTFPHFKLQIFIFSYFSCCIAYLTILLNDCV